MGLPMRGSKEVGQEATEGTVTLEKGRRPQMHPCSSIPLSLAGTRLGCSPGREDLGAPRGLDITSLCTAPMTCLQNPSLPKVTALTG